MMVIDCLHAQQASGARIGSDCYAHAALRILAQLQLRTLGELTMCTLHLERELCARLLCSREAAASLRRPSVGLSASARGAKSASSRIHLAPFYAPPTQCGGFFQSFPQKRGQKIRARYARRGFFIRRRRFFTSPLWGS